MITTKSERELLLMREAGRIVALTLKAVEAAIEPGISTIELDAIAEAVIRQHDATPSFKGYHGFPSSICASINQVLVHGIPSGVKLKDGDIISIDVGACYKGYHGDAAATFAVGTIATETQRLLDVTKESLSQGLAFAKPGNHLHDISYAIGSYVMANGYSVPMDYTGHGIGSHLHEDPMIPNYGTKGTGVVLKPGMTLAIEPMVHQGKPQTKVLKDGWTVVTNDGSLACHFEHTIVITETGFKFLTEL